MVWREKRHAKKKKRKKDLSLNAPLAQLSCPCFAVWTLELNFTLFVFVPVNRKPWRCPQGKRHVFVLIRSIFPLLIPWCNKGTLESGLPMISYWEAAHDPCAGREESFTGGWALSAGLSQNAGSRRVLEILIKKSIPQFSSFPSHREDELLSPELQPPVLAPWPSGEEKGPRSIMEELFAENWGFQWVQAAS